RNVCSGDCQSAGESAARLRLLEAQLETLHEVDPVAWLPFQGLNDGPRFVFAEAIGLKHLRHLAHFLVRNLLHFTLLTFAFLGVVLGVAFSREITAEAHRDGAGGDFGKTGSDDDAGVIDSAGQSSRERERYR